MASIRKKIYRHLFLASDSFLRDVFIYYTSQTMILCFKAVFWTASVAVKYLYVWTLFETYVNLQC